MRRNGACGIIAARVAMYLRAVRAHAWIPADMKKPGMARNALTWPSRTDYFEACRRMAGSSAAAA